MEEDQHEDIKEDGLKISWNGLGKRLTETDDDGIMF